MGRSIFLNSTGKNVARLPDPHFGVNDIGLMTFEELSDATAAIAVTNLQDRVTPRYQVTDTLGERTILNTFGRSIDTRTIDGMCYEGFCTDDDDDESGFEGIMRFFDTNNAGIRDTPIIITVGKSFARSCYLLEMTVGLADSTMRIWQFQAKLIVEPERDQDDQRRPDFLQAGISFDGTPAIALSSVPTAARVGAPFTSNNILSWLPAGTPATNFATDNSGVLRSPLSTSSFNASPLTVASIGRSGDPSNIDSQATSRVARTSSGLNPFVVA